ncbi:MAG TPA: hypothetical protein VJL83_00770 [Patescibacteria group bacterium]|nr:hypothetical protein [Patescibacteria group bacterium]
MSDIQINSHDVLGKLSIIKNYAAMAIEKLQEEGSQSIQYISTIREVNESLIQEFKKKAEEKRNEELATRD